MESILDSTGARRVDVVNGDYGQWLSWTEELERRGVPIPLEHTTDWLERIEPGEHWFAGVRETVGGSLTAAFPVRRQPLRSLPGHYRLRVTRFGSAADEAALLSGLEALPTLVTARRRVLGVNVELFTADQGRRGRIEEVAPKMGYSRARPYRRYRYTVRLDLSPSEDELMASFSTSCRRNIRLPAKKGFAIEPMTQGRWAQRMDELWIETFSRTGAQPPYRIWRDHLALAARKPHLYHILGTFGPGYPRESSLVAFTCARHNGDHTAYADAASTRNVPHAVPVVYAPVWFMIQWAKRHGCTWFDMGGVPEGTDEDTTDPRHGIAEFKLRFSEEVIEVGSEWRFEPSSWRTTVSESISSSASFVRRLSRRAGA